MSPAFDAYGLGFSEDALVEQPAIQLLRQLGWEAGDPFDPVWGPRGSLGRESDHEVVLLARLRPEREAHFFIHHLVRDDQQALFGFSSAEDGRAREAATREDSVAVN